MKERPILFSGEMVRAILDGRKTMTRRVIKPQPTNSHWEGTFKDYSLKISHPYPEYVRFSHNIESNHEWATPMIVCPYGTVGDCLWVRETFLYAQTEHDNLMSVKTIIYRADDDEEGHKIYFNRKWKPSIFMPREASRILLEITDIRVERLNDISESDAQAEGAELMAWGDMNRIPVSLYAGKSILAQSHRYGFFNIWEKINGSGSWEKNPWVWVICFKRVER